MKVMNALKKAFLINIVLIILCGLIYPACITGIGQLFFHKKANGSMIEFNGKEVGSELIGQSFTDPRFLSGRVSYINYNTYKKGDKSYQGVQSGSQNLAPSSKQLQKRVKNDIDEFLKKHPEVKESQIPEDLLTSSGSGLDPDISPEAAKIQIPEISKASHISEKRLEKIINDNTENKTFGIFGEPRVNVLKVNLEIASILKIK